MNINLPNNIATYAVAVTLVLMVVAGIVLLPSIWGGVLILSAVLILRFGFGG